MHLAPALSACTCKAIRPKPNIQTRARNPLHELPAKRDISQLNVHLALPLSACTCEAIRPTPNIQTHERNPQKELPAKQDISQSTQGDDEHTHNTNATPAELQAQRARPGQVSDCTMHQHWPTRTQTTHWPCKNTRAPQYQTPKITHAHEHTASRTCKHAGTHTQQTKQPKELPRGERAAKHTQKAGNTHVHQTSNPPTNQHRNPRAIGRSGRVGGSGWQKAGWAVGRSGGQADGRAYTLRVRLSCIGEHSCMQTMYGSVCAHIYGITRCGPDHHSIIASVWMHHCIGIAASSHRHHFGFKMARA